MFETTNQCDTCYLYKVTQFAKLVQTYKSNNCWVDEWGYIEPVTIVYIFFLNWGGTAL